MFFRWIKIPSSAIAAVAVAVAAAASIAVFEKTIRYVAFSFRNRKSRILFCFRRHQAAETSKSHCYIQGSSTMLIES